ncbi:MAG: translation initiation factor IF-3 [Nitrospirae bacterium]|nr:translation initiation factor IF-3 [Nitrospirota bacterium]
MATKPRVNREIKTDKIRVISSKNEQLGVLLVPEALRLAEAEGLDLVEVAPTAAPPVCRIMDYGKYKYEQTKKQHAAKLHQRGTQLKEVKFRPFTSQHDVDYKLRHAIDFLADGHKVKLTVMFRGRELAHQEAGHALLDRLKTALADVCTPDHPARTEGRNMMIIVSPKAQAVGKRKTAAKPKKAAASGAVKKSPTPAEAPAAVAPAPPAGPASETTKDA